MPSLPKAGQFRAWKNTVFQNVNVAAQRDDDEALEWVSQVDDVNVTDEALAERPPTKFIQLSKRLATALQKIAHGELGREITQRVSRALDEKRSACGLELLRIICAYYATNRTAARTCSIADLQKVKLTDRKNGDLEKLQNDWSYVMDNLVKDVDPDTKEYIFYEIVKEHTLIAVEVAHYDRIEDENPPHKDRCFTYLWDSVTRAIRRKRMKGMQEANSKAIEGLSQQRSRGVPARKGEEKGSARSRSPSAGACDRRPRHEVPCKFYLEGTCMYGAKCEWRHGKKPGMRRDSSGSDRKGKGKGGAKKPERKDATAGKGKKGERSRSRSIVPKKPCPHYAKGRCKFGDKCRMSHGGGRAAPAVPAGAAEAVPSSDSESASSTEKKRLGKKKKGKKKAWALPAAVTFSSMIEKATLTRAGAIVNPRSEPIKGQGPCCPARALGEPTRWWLCDTGCPYDLPIAALCPAAQGKPIGEK